MKTAMATESIYGQRAAFIKENGSTIIGLVMVPDILPMALSVNAIGLQTLRTTQLLVVKARAKYKLRFQSAVLSARLNR